MIIKFRVVRRDTKAPIQGAKIVLEHGEKDGITNSAGEAEIITYWSGNLMYSVTAAGYDKIAGTVESPKSGSVTKQVELGAMVAPPPPPKDGETGRDQFHYCTRIAYNKFGEAWCDVTHPKYGTIYSGIKCRDAYDKMRADPRCREQPEPTPTPKTADDVQKDVDILRGTLQGISSRVQDLTAGLEKLGKELLDIEARIKAWIEEQIIAILLRALDRESEKVK